MIDVPVMPVVAGIVGETEVPMVPIVEGTLISTESVIFPDSLGADF
jgi:hypothetical protein